MKLLDDEERHRRRTRAGRLLSIARVAGLDG